MKQFDIIMTGSQGWDTPIGSNCKDIARTWSKNHRVLYVNWPLDRKSKWTRPNDPDVQIRQAVLDGKHPDIDEVLPNLFSFYPKIVQESINPLPPGFIYKWANKRNARRYAAEIQRAAKELGFGKETLLFIDNDMLRSFYLPDMLKPEVSVYYFRDNLTYMAYWERHGSYMQHELVRKVDLVCTNSDYLGSIVKKDNPKVYYTGQGCDLTAFDPDSIAAPPADMLPWLTKPTIGYAGALEPKRLSLDVLEALARDLPQYNLLLIGPQTAGFDAARLAKYPNVWLPGPKLNSEIAAYMKYFSVAINPQVINVLTMGNYPRKLDEYLAMGLPVLATGTEFMKPWEGYAYLAQNEAEFVKLAKQAIEEDSPEKRQARIAFAHTHSWEATVKTIEDAIVHATSH